MTRSRTALVRNARWLRGFTYFGMVLIAAAVVGGAWVLLAGVKAEGMLTFRVETDGLAPEPAAAILALSGGLLIAALVEIAAMLRAVEAGAPFRTAARLRAFASYLFLGMLAADLLPTLVQLVQRVVLGQPGPIGFSLDGGDLLMLFVTGLLFLVARLIDAAQQLADEHEQIV